MRNARCGALTITPVSATVDSLQSDLLCLVCERDDRDGLLLCSGPCVSAFHAACLGVDARNATTATATAGATWKCPSCASHTHECFHCKRRGMSVPSTSSADAVESDGRRPGVRKCRALSCGKFYHSACIAKLPLARIAGSHFICPVRACV